MKLFQSTVNERGIAALELAMLLPVMLIMAFAVIDFGRLIETELVITNMSREGGSLASRDLLMGASLCTMLQDSSYPLDMQDRGKIYISIITAGVSKNSPDPTISSQSSAGNLAVPSVISGGSPQLGLSTTMYNHLVFNNANQAPDLSVLTVVEVYYEYIPITPLPQFAQNLLFQNGVGMVVGTKAVF